MKLSIPTLRDSWCATALALVLTVFVPAHADSFERVQVLSNDEITWTIGGVSPSGEIRGGNGRSSTTGSSLDPFLFRLPD